MSYHIISKGSRGIPCPIKDLAYKIDIVACICDELFDFKKDALGGHVERIGVSPSVYDFGRFQCILVTIYVVLRNNGVGSPEELYAMAEHVKEMAVAIKHNFLDGFPDCKLELQFDIKIETKQEKE